MTTSTQMIFDAPPKDWKHLQQLVHQAFIEMGCHAEEPKIVVLVRGNKEVDVYVEDVVHGIKNVYLIECKYWNSDLPQEVVHGFRTVVADSGANKGIIVAKKGFQSGANEAISKTPTDLLTWEEFNIVFFKKWRSAATESLQDRARKLLEFREFPYGPMCDETKVKLSPEEHNLWAEYVNGFEITIVLATRNILKELSDGSVRLVDPRSPLNDFEQVKFWIVETHREWYDYISSQLNFWLGKTEAWMKSFAARSPVE